MRIHFWGVRGSIPVVKSSSQIKSKISAILEQLTVEDLKDVESKERFLAGLPPWLFGAVGGNTPCVSVLFEDTGTCIVFDCGSGLRELGNHAAEVFSPSPKQFHIFLSHFHWDHLQGLPFFGPLYDPSVKLDFYSPKTQLEKALNTQMGAPFFPVNFNKTGSAKTFNLIKAPLEIDGRQISFKKLNHPGDSFAYCISEKGKRFIYATDVELTAPDFMKTRDNSAFFQDADMIVLDCQYTMGEAITKYNWGHSSFTSAVDFAVNWGIKHMVMFHHEPLYNDRKLYGIFHSAQWYLKRMDIKGLEISLACEGKELNL
ncbi:MAG: MBL fold metallo-hydrolase [Spirochaetes bacterium]|nr:MBL fold metallo-hydrolase [Spirochaetota bacterium]